MNDFTPNQRELFDEFWRLVDASITRHVTTHGDDDVKAYLAQLLTAFLHTDRIFSVRDADGRTVESVTDMVAEGDVRVRAESFERERAVHKHIGDFILFWQGVYPEYLRQIKVLDGRDLLCDYPRQGRESYRVVSQFAMPPYVEEARTCAKLSDGFDDYAFCLGDVARRLRLPPGAQA